MKPNIALLVPEHIAEFFRLSAEALADRCTVAVLTYDTMADLPELFKAAQPEYDGFCTLGKLALKLVQETAGPTKPIVTITGKSVDYYKNFFALLDEQRDIDFSRVLLDYSLAQDRAPSSVVDFYSSPQSFEHRRDRLARDVDTAFILTMEQNIARRARQLWQQGAFDVLICRYGSVAKAMKEAGIPHSFVYPDPEQVRETLEMLLDAIHFRAIAGGMPAVIYVSAPELAGIDRQDVNIYQVNVEKALLDFSRRNMADFVVQQVAGGYEILASRNMAQKITDGFTTCRLVPLLNDAAGVDAQVGYGLGRDLLAAKANAAAALKLAGQQTGSWVIDADEPPAGLSTAPPAQKQSGRDFTPRQIEAARLSGLSVNTIQRIMDAAEVLGSREMTSQDLAHTLQVTVANANRFLNTLAENGLADVLARKKHQGKGRPSKIYRLSI